MADANFGLVFLGIENLQKKNLMFIKKGDIIDKTKWLIKELHYHNIMVMGGFILGNPDDNKEDIIYNMSCMKKLMIDSFLVQMLTPYPGTSLHKIMKERGLIAKEDYSRYNGFYANMKTNKLSPQELDYLVWKYFPYYRSPTWLIKAVLPRAIPLILAKESLRRIRNIIGTELQKIIYGEEYTFLKYMQRNINMNRFFDDRVSLEEVRCEWKYVPKKRGHTKNHGVIKATPGEDKILY